MDFIRYHFGKMQLWQVEHFFLHEKEPVVLYRYLFVKKKVFNLSKIHVLRGQPISFSEEIYTLYYYCIFTSVVLIISLIIHSCVNSLIFSDIEKIGHGYSQIIIYSSLGFRQVYSTKTFIIPVILFSILYNVSKFFELKCVKSLVLQNNTMVAGKELGGLNVF